jgi:hypothetical protein
MLPPARTTGAAVAAGFVAVAGTVVEPLSMVADAAGASVGGAVGATVSAADGASALGATGGVTVGPGANVAGWSGRGVLVGVGVGPDAAGEQELNKSPADTNSSKSIQSQSRRTNEGF